MFIYISFYSPFRFSLSSPFSHLSCYPGKRGVPGQVCEPVVLVDVHVASEQNTGHHQPLKYHPYISLRKHIYYQPLPSLLRSPSHVTVSYNWSVTLEMWVLSNESYSFARFRSRRKPFHPHFYIKLQLNIRTYTQREEWIYWARNFGLF